MLRLVKIQYSGTEDTYAEEKTKAPVSEVLNNLLQLVVYCY